MRHKAQSLLAASLLGLAISWHSAAPARSANPPLTPLRALCTAQNGTFFPSLTGQYVVCDSNPALGFTAQQEKVAGLLCTHAYGGQFVVSPPAGDRTFPLWYCVFNF
jgi:hypothetical protein